LFTGYDFTNEKEDLALYAKNQCFRNEEEYDGFKKLREFIKIEQFVFCNPNNWEPWFENLMYNQIGFLKNNNIEYRLVDVTNTDKGYHKKKVDIEIFTKKYFFWIWSGRNNFVYYAFGWGSIGSSCGDNGFGSTFCKTF
jgi:seryl-tRNA synthetase